MIKNEILKLINGIDLTEDEMMNCMSKIMSGVITDTQIASFLTALKAKGETLSEIAGGAKVLREKAEKIDLYDYYTVDTCGTGGDHSGTYNISTAVSFVAAAAGVTIVKHGNRSISSKCGAADVLEALGVRIDLTPKEVEACVRNIGMGFFFAPTFHKTMGYVGKARKELGFRTIFNILGPLANPASAKAQILGVYDAGLTEIMAEVLRNLGVKRALVVYGLDGLDELSTTSETKVTELRDGSINTYSIKPEDFGFKRSSVKDIQGGNATENAQIIRDLFNGREGAKMDILLLNTGAALYVANKVDSIQEGIKQAKHIINDGKVHRKMDEFILQTNIT